MRAAKGGEPLCVALKKIGEQLMIEPEQLEDRRVQLVDVNSIFPHTYNR